MHNTRYLRAATISSERPRKNKTLKEEICTYKCLVDSIAQLNAKQEKGKKIEKHKSRVPLN